MGGRLSKITYSIGARISLTMIGMAVIILVFAIALYAAWQAAVYFTLPLDQRERWVRLFDETYELYKQSAIRTGWLPTDDRWILAIILMVACVVGVTLAFWVARRISEPLKTLSTTAGRVAKGDFSARVELPASARVDETTVLAQNFNLMAESLERLEAERKFTAAAIAHELRTPLTILRGKLEGIKYGVTPPSEPEIDGMLGQIEVLTRLVNDMKTLSLAEAGKLSLERQPLELSTLVQTVCTSFQAKATANKVQLKVQTQSPIRVSGDSSRLQQVLGNLLENALRHTPSGGEVQVNLSQTNGKIELRVSDSGGGIPSEDLPHIFERFYRAEKSRGRSSGGSGLGLAIVRTLIELHGGSIEARNQARGGAEFVVRLG